MVPVYPKWAFLGSRAWDGDLVNVIYLESNLKSTGVRKARKSKGKRLSKDGLAPGVLLHCDCRETLKSTSCTVVSSSLKQGGGLFYPVPVRLWWRAVFQGSGSCEALTANSQSSWEIGAPAGKGLLDGTPPPSSAHLCFRAPTVPNAVLSFLDFTFVYSSGPLWARSDC